MDDDDDVLEAAFREAAVVEVPLAPPERSSGLKSLHAKLKAARSRRDAPRVAVKPVAAGDGALHAFAETLRATDPQLAALFSEVVVVGTAEPRTAVCAEDAVAHWTSVRREQREGERRQRCWEAESRKLFCDFENETPKTSSAMDEEDSSDDEARVPSEGLELLAVLQQAFAGGGAAAMSPEVVLRLAALEGVLVEQSQVGRDDETRLGAASSRGQSQSTAVTATEEVAVVSQQSLALHRAVYRGAFSEVRAFFSEQRKAEGALLLDVVDARGNTPLLLALKLGRAPVASFLIHAGATADVKSDGHFHLLDDAVATGDRQLVSLAYRAMQRGIALRLEQRAPHMAQALAALPDFSLTIKCGLRGKGALKTLVSAFGATETYRVYKRGCNVRVDSTVVGVKAASSAGQRGHSPASHGGRSGESSSSSSSTVAQLMAQRLGVPSLERGAVSLLFCGGTGESSSRDTAAAAAAAAAGSFLFEHRGHSVRVGDVLVVDRVARTVDSWPRRMRDPTADELKLALDGMMDARSKPLYSLDYGAETLAFEEKRLGSRNPLRRDSYLKEIKMVDGAATRRYVATAAARVAVYKKAGLDQHAPLADVPFEHYFDDDESASQSQSQSPQASSSSSSRRRRTALKPVGAVKDAAFRVKTIRKQVEIKVDMADSLPLALRDLLPCLEIAALREDAFFAKVEGIMRHSTLPPTLFPKRVKVPLILGVEARVDFTDIKRGNVSESLFQLPADLQWIVP